MKGLPLCIVCFMGQMNTMQKKPVVHLQPSQSQIQKSFGGVTLELLNAPAVINLPKYPPKESIQGELWTVEVKNMGPKLVTIIGGNAFSVQVGVGRTVIIASNGKGYSLKY